MKKTVFLFVILFSLIFILLAPNKILAEEGTCTCSGESSMNETTCNQPNNYCNFTNGKCLRSFQKIMDSADCNPSKVSVFINEPKKSSFDCDFIASSGDTQGPLPPSGDTEKLPSSGDTAYQPQKAAELPKLLETESINVVIGRIIKFIIGFSGSLALLMFVYGGIMWLISRGNQDFVKKGKSAMMYATIGLVIIFTSYILVRFIVAALGSVS